ALIAGILDRARKQLELARLGANPAVAPLGDPEPARARHRRFPPQPRAKQAHSGASEGVKLLAVQMALEGTTADEIRPRLRHEFGVNEPGAAVAELFNGSPAL